MWRDAEKNLGTLKSVKPGTPQVGAARGDEPPRWT